MIAVNKKIRVIIGSLDVGGTEKQLINILNGLTKKGWDIEVFVITHKGKLAKFLNRKIKISCLSSKKRIKIFSLFLYIFKLYKIFKKDPHTTTHFFLPQAYMLGMFSSIIANSRCKLIMSRRSLNFYQNKYFFIRFIEKFLHKRVHKILVNSQEIKKQLIKDEKVEKNKIKLIKNGINLKKFKKIHYSQKKKFTITIIANLIPYKCHKLLFKSLNHIKEKLPVNWELFCIGRDDGLKKELIDIAKRYKIEKNIFWKETLKVEKILSKSDIGVLCSSEEGFPNVLLEYYASKLPVISTNVGGCNEIVKNKKNGILIKKNNYKELADAILFLYNNQKLSKNFGVNGFKEVKKNYNILKTIKMHEEIYI